MDKKTETVTYEVSILREEVIHNLKTSLEQFSRHEIDGLRLWTGAVNAWNKAIKNEGLL